MSISNKANLLLLIEALRSGEFEQGRGVLRRGADEIDDKFCCLGVACELYSQQVGGHWYAEGGFDLQFIADYVYDPMHDRDLPDWSCTGLPRAVQKWLALPTAFGMENPESVLIGMNDKGRTFSEIADYLEAQIDKPGNEWDSEATFFSRRSNA